MNPLAPSNATVTLNFASAASSAEPGGEVPRLLIIDGSSSSIHHLAQSGELIIGRTEEAHIRLADNAVSRQHARLSVGEFGVCIEDLGSHNGTKVNGERITAPRELGSGDVIVICGVTLVFHSSRLSALVRPIHDGIAPLRRRLEEEVARAQKTHRAVSIVALGIGGQGGLRRLQLAAALSRVLRIIDIAAWEGDSRLWAMLPEIDELQVAEVAARMVAAAVAIFPEARAGTATCPSDGYDATALLAGARAALDAAPAGELRAAAATMTVLRIADRSIVVADPVMVRLYALIERLAQGELPVLIHGETGSGKEIAAQALHARSKRAAARLISINCAALPESLAESELFGHEKGAFSGAVAQKIGYIESAHGGTLFLDEIGELSLSIQAKLLRVLESKKLIRVGEVRERSVDVRIVAATHRDLLQEVKQGRFREDLYFRLNSAVLNLPPLRERPRELPLLARAFLTEACQRVGNPKLIIAPATLDLLLRYRWPGNVRELRNVMEYAATVVTEPVLAPEHLPATLQAPALPASAPPAPAPSVANAAPDAAQEAMPEGSGALTQTARSILRMNLSNKLDAVEEALIREAMALAAGNKTAAARLLGVHRKVIERRLDKFE